MIEVFIAASGNSRAAIVGDPIHTATLPASASRVAAALKGSRLTEREGESFARDSTFGSVPIRVRHAEESAPGRAGQGVRDENG